MPHWDHVVLHHSFTGDSTLPEATAIKRFHTSYRQGGDIITQEQYNTKRTAGEGGLSSPWADVGYHRLVETLRDGAPWVLQGRSMMLAGAHCRQAGMNRRGIGVCVIGNFDLEPPAEKTFELTAEFTSWLCRMYRIPVLNVRAHRDYANYKTCPGSAFDMDYFRERVEDYLKQWGA